MTTPAQMFPFLLAAVLPLPAVAAESDAMAVRLACPASPNCVNSLGVGGLPPLAYTGDAAQGMARLRATLTGFSEARIEADDGQSITTIFTTLLGFRDEVVFVVDPAQPVIHFRSRSLLGYYDFGKNRSRMQAVSERFAATPQP
jgi:uncharacterized protein (DUF1499 family)